MGRVGRCVFTTTVFGTCVFCVEYGRNEEKTETKIASEQTVGKGGGRPGGTTEKEKKGDREVGILRRMLRVLSGVARGSHSALPPAHSSESSLVKSPWTGVTVPPFKIGERLIFAFCVCFCV